MNISQFTPTQLAIITEISRAFDRLGAERGIFSAVNSWGDTLPDEDVLSQLKELNDQSAESVTLASLTHV